MRSLRRIITFFVIMAVGALYAQDGARVTGAGVGDASVDCMSDSCAYDNTIITNYEAGAVYGGGSYAPMWHFANMHGIGSQKSNWAYVSAGVDGCNIFKNTGISLNWGVEIVGGYNLASNVFVQQAYLDFDWKRVRVSLGQKECWGEIQNPRLTTGALVESGNARPIPQIRLELPEYWNIPGTNGLVGIKGHIAYGWFTDGRWREEFVDSGKAHASGILYHSKAGFVRLGNEERFPLTAEIGLHMVTQFGGTSHNHLNKSGVTLSNPTRFKDYLMAFIPAKGDSQYSMADQVNIMGNMLGSWLGSVTWNSEGWKLRLTYEHVFEDHSQMFWEYGLWTEQLVGLELVLKRNRWVNGLSFEYFNLKKQSGPVYHDSNSLIPDQISCVDNNYWHHTYNGWFNYGMMIGTPLVSSPLYNTDGTLGIYNNRVEAFHFGICGSPFKWLDYRVLVTRSNNWGTYSEPFTEIKNNTSGLVEFTFAHPSNMRWSARASFAFDKGELYGNNYGGMITITYRDIFRF